MRLVTPVGNRRIGQGFNKMGLVPDDVIALTSIREVKEQNSVIGGDVLVIV